MAPGRKPAVANPRGVSRVRLGALALGLSLLYLAGVPAFGADTLAWSTNRNRVSADIRADNLLHVLGQIARTTGWQVFVERGAARTVSTKFSDLPTGEALRLLLGDLNF